MSTKDKHKRVDLVYKIALVTISAATIFLLSEVKVALFIFTVLWIFTSEIEKFIEDHIK